MFIFSDSRGDAMRYTAYAPGSIVDQIERGHLPANNNVQPDRVITVSAVNHDHMTIYTQHYYQSSAEFQRKLYRDRRYQNIT